MREYIFIENHGIKADFPVFIINHRAEYTVLIHNVLQRSHITDIPSRAAQALFTIRDHLFHYAVQQGECVPAVHHRYNGHNKITKFGAGSHSRKDIVAYSIDKAQWFILRKVVIDDFIDFPEFDEYVRVFKPVQVFENNDAVFFKL